MSRPDEALRRQVARRADGCCEYCRLPDRCQIGGFEIDHIHPVSLGGLTALENLAWACPHCNNRKSNCTAAPDPATGMAIGLFNPRVQSWADHFQWPPEPSHEFVGLTPCGRATIAALELNHADLVRIRTAFASLGLLVRP